MLDPRTGLPLNYSVRSQEQWNSLVETAQMAADRTGWSVGIWFNVKTWAVRLFVGAGAVTAGGPGYRAMLRIMPGQVVKPAVSEAVWVRYNSRHILYRLDKRSGRFTEGTVSLEQEHHAEVAAEEDARLGGSGRRLASADVTARDAAMAMGKAMARGVEAEGGPLPPDGRGGKRRKAPPVGEEDPF